MAVSAVAPAMKSELKSCQPKSQRPSPSVVPITAAKCRSEGSVGTGNAETSGASVGESAAETTQSTG